MKTQKKNKPEEPKELGNPIGKVSIQPIVGEVQESYLNYAMSVIIARALPDVRDGLKPVHRRILYAMWENGLRSNAKFRKCATIVGSVLSLYHPHGDIAVYDSLVRMAQDFSLRYPLVHGQGNFGCFTKDTKVKLTDGRNLSFEDLTKESKQGKKNFTYTINKLGLITIAEIKKPRLTKKNAEIIKVVLDNGEQIRCTPNHLFMTRNGSFKEAQYLASGESLMPIYQKISEKTDRLNREGYILIYQNKTKEWVPTHHLADNHNLNAKKYPKSAGRVRHHLDFNKLNNNPDNIQKITQANKNRASNNTGKTKFLTICKKVLATFQSLNSNLYEQLRHQIYPYGMATTWDTGFKKYFNQSIDQVFKEINRNHKISRIEVLKSKEDVYDLTIDGTHNFALASGIFVHNSMDGDSAAAYRYTEAKLSKVAEELLYDIENDTVDFVANYDGTHQEPKILPAKLPNLLLNGSMGIAVGMATNIPPHNLTELCDAIIYLIDHPNAEIEELMEFVKGPDFPTGGIIYDRKEIAQAYTTGRGKIVMRAKTEIVEDKNGQFKIIVTEVPYQVNKATLVEKIADLVHEKKIEGIKDLRDESNKDGVRVVIELKKDGYPKKILNQLFNLTSLQDTFHVNLLALVDGIQPRTLNLRIILDEYLKHRQIVVTRRTEFFLQKAKERAHILEGLMVAIKNIDAVIKTIKQSKDKDEARVNLMKKFKLTEIQANAILEMKLQQLANLESQKIEDELKEKSVLIKELQAILASPKKIKDIVKKETTEIKEKFGDERRTQIVAHGVKEFSTEDLVPNEDTLVMITQDGYIKRLPPDTFKTQHRGGKGVIGVTTKEEDIVEHLFSTTTHADLLFFTTKGRVFQLRAYDVPQGSRTSKGQAIVNFLQLSQEEKVSAVLSLTDLADFKYLVMVTKKGVTKKVDIKDFSAVRRSGLIALKLKGDDLLEWVKPSTGSDEIMLITGNGQAIRFKEKIIRAMGRNASGVRGMRLKGTDAIVGMDIIDPALSKTMQLFVISEEGLGKRTPISQYRLQGRGGSGIKTAKVNKKTGRIIGAYVVNAKDERDLLVVSAKGQIIRLPFGTVSTSGRATQGVRLMRFKETNDKVASVTLV